MSTPLQKVTIITKDASEKDSWVDEIQKQILALANMQLERQKRSSSSTKINAEVSPAVSAPATPSLAPPATSKRASGDFTAVSALDAKAAIRMKYNSLNIGKERTASLGDSPSTTSASTEKPPEEDTKTRTWKRASMAANRDAHQQLQEERKVRKSLQEAQITHESNIQLLRQSLTQSEQALEQEKHNNEELKKELEEVKQKLVQATIQLMQLKEDKEASTTTTTTTTDSGESTPEKSRAKRASTANSDEKSGTKGNSSGK